MMHQAVAINLTAVIAGTALGGERMSDGGVIINIASMAGIVPVPLCPGPRVEFGCRDRAVCACRATRVQ